MEYIELDIKQIIYEILLGKIVPYSIELNCELHAPHLNRLYGTCVYYGEEVNDIVEVIADFNCMIEQNTSNGTTQKTPEKGNFRCLFNREYKSIIDGSSKVTI